MDEVFINALPISEVTKLNQVVAKFITFDEKN